MIEQNQMLFDLYKNRIEALVDQYYYKYLAEYKTVTVDDAITFLSVVHDEYRKAVATISTNAIHEHMGNTELTNAIATQNKFSIGALFGRFHNIIVS